MCKNVILIILVCTTILSLSQTETQTNSLLDFASEQTRDYEKRKDEAIKWAIQNNYPVIAEINGTTIEIQFIDENGQPQYYKTDNVNAAATISTNKVYPGGDAGLNLTGSGITIREWDAGSALTTHQEFGGRVTNVDGGSSHYHSTHVAGTIMASGVVPEAKGMAYQANLRSRNWYNDVSEMASEAASGALMSCHSYGYTRGWYWFITSWAWAGNPAISTQEDYLFGFYDSSTWQWDQVARNAPYYLICKSAGNDRIDTGDGSYPPDGPYDCLGQQSVAKNILTIGAIEDIPEGYTVPEGVVMSAFSSWGPADDGRIKPDIVANGVSLYSTYNSNNSSYTSLSGTSMATPSVTGSLALLQQHNYSLTGNYLRSATLKALVIHTADEAGNYIGPDYQFGWGIMNTRNASLKISDDQAFNVISELTLNNGGIFTRDVVALGTEPIKVTIVWTDVAGTPVSAQLDPITPMLVNDLDLKITGLGSTYFPWKLDRDNPENAATNVTENNVDNVEVVYISNPLAGETYTVSVDHDGYLNGGSQAFSMILTGIVMMLPPVADFTASNTTPLTGQTIEFSDLSTNTPAMWLWSFLPETVTYIGGTSATSQNPQVQFNDSGLYTVTLTAANAEGSDEETKTDYIFVTAPPIADFSADNTTPGIGQTVSFTDLSIHGPTLWTWAFNPSTVTFVEGTSAASQNPQLQFDAPGAYSVELTVSNAAGSDTESKTDYVVVIYPPVADFLANNTSPNAGDSVIFTDISSNNPSAWSWVFIPSTVSYLAGTSSESQNPKVQFETPGSYTIELTVENASGSDTETKIGYIVVTAPPIADFSADNTTPGIGQTVSFTDLSIHGPTLWTWAFNPSTVTFVEGTSAASQNPQLQFDAPGAYSVELTVSNAAGSDTESKTDYVVVIYPPVADFLANNTSPNAGDSVIFTDISSNNPSAWSWVFIPSTVSYLAGTSSESQNPKVQFETPGSYTIELTVENASGSDTETKIGYIVVTAPPIADFSADNTTPGIGQTVSFTDLSIHGPTLWTWAFNPSTVTFVEGTSAASQNPQLQFDAPGAYSVELTVSNAAGSDTESKTDYVVVIYPPVADFLANNTSPNAGDSVIFTDISSNNPSAWSWVFIPSTVSYLAGTSSESQNPKVQFETPGSYTIELTVENASGSDTETKIGYIVVTAPPIADFSADNTTPGIGQTVSFTDLSIHGPTLWTWAFNPSTVTFVEGTSAASQNPQLQFDAPGAYSVELTVSNAAGSDTESKTDYVVVIYPPVADFLANNTSPNAGDSVIFTDISSNNPSAWSWVFIPSTVSYLAGTSSESQNPKVQFETPGSYTIELTVENASGSDTETKIGYIVVTAPPIADFSADNTTPGIGQTVSFTDLSIHGPTLWTWAFNPSTVTFVEGTSAASQNPQLQFDAPGAYSVELTVSNAAGSDTESKTDYVVVIYPPVADFLANNTSPNAGDSVIFTDISSNNPSAWSWVFIPSTVSYLAGTSSESQNPKVQFETPGSYTIELTVENASGSDTETKTNFILVINPVINLDITVYLEGPFNGANMSVNLTNLPEFPLTQPYGMAPWNYGGSESVGAIPNPNVVDWMLVELRDAADAASATSSTMMDRQAAFLLNNGRVVGLDGSSTLQFSNSLTQKLFVVIWHRNHLGMMSSNFLSESEGIYSYNFSTGATQAYGSTDAHKQIGPGVWGMIGGDGNRDGNITTTDKTPVWDTQSGTQGYLESDFNLDTQSDNKDKDDVWDPNLGMGSMVPN